MHDFKRSVAFPVISVLIAGALFFFANTASVRAADAYQAYEAITNVSGGIEAGLGVAGDKTGAALNATSKVLGGAGAFFDRISAGLFDGARSLPQLSRVSASGLAGIAKSWGTALAIIAGLLIAGFVLVQLFKIDALRRIVGIFLFKGFMGAIIIAGFIGLVAWVARQLPSFENTADSLKTVSEDVTDATAPESPDYQDSYSRQPVFVEDEAVLDEFNAEVLTETDEPSLLGKIVQWPARAVGAMTAFTKGLAAPLLFWQEDSVDGGWSAWSDWGECSSACGGGIKFRTRVCDNPAPQGLGAPCAGIDRYFRNCNTQACAPQPIACSQGCFNTCGPYRDINECGGDTCASCLSTCQSDADCDVGAARCGYNSRAEVLAGHKTCLYYLSAPLLADFQVSRQDDEASVSVSWDINPTEENRVDYFELWRKPRNGDWEAVPDRQFMQASSRSVSDVPPPGQSYQYGIHVVEKSQYTAYSLAWFEARGYGLKDLYRLVKDGYGFADADRIRREGLSADDEAWLAANGYDASEDDIRSMIKTDYSTEGMAGFAAPTVAIPNPNVMTVNTLEFMSTREGTYTVGYAAGSSLTKPDKVYGDVTGVITVKGKYNPQASTFIGYGHFQYFSKGDSEDPYDQIMVLSPYTSTGSHPLWLLGSESGFYGEMSGGIAQSGWSLQELKGYFKNTTLPKQAAQAIFYQLKNDTTFLPYTDTYFPSGPQTLQVGGRGTWLHGNRPFAEWQGDTYYLGGMFKSKNSGFIEMVRWTGEDYLNYVNSYYRYLQDTKQDFVGINQRICTRTTDFFATKGFYTGVPMCPSRRMLERLDATATETEYNIMRVVFYEDVPGIPARCKNNFLKMPHPYQDGTVLALDEQAQAGGYESSDSVCVYEDYFLRGHDMIARNGGYNSSSEIYGLGFSVDIGENGLFEFMFYEPVKGSGSGVYVIEPVGRMLFKYLLTSEEYQQAGGRYIPIADSILNNIPDL